MEKLQALKRIPNLSELDSMELDSETTITRVPMLVREQMKISKMKNLTDEERGIHAIAAQLRVNGQKVTYDDLLDCFTANELTKIAEFVTAEEDNTKNV